MELKTAGGEFQATWLVNGAVSGTKRAGGEFQAIGLVNGAVSGTNRAGGEFQDVGLVNVYIGVILAFDGSFMKSNAT